MKKFRIYKRLTILFTILTLISAALGAVAWSIPSEVSGVVNGAIGIFGVDSGFDLTARDTRELTLLILIGVFALSLLLQLIFMIKAFSRAGDLLAIAGTKRQASMGVAKVSTEKSKTSKEAKDVKTIKERKAEIAAKKAAKSAEKAAAKAEKVAKKAAKAVEETSEAVKETIAETKKENSKFDDILKGI